MRAVNKGSHRIRAAQCSDTCDFRRGHHDVCVAIRKVDWPICRNCYIIWVSSAYVCAAVPIDCCSSRMSSGVYASLVASPIVFMGERHDVGTRVGMSFTVLALGALAGPPISGAIYDATGDYKPVGYYAGKM